jgi:hypothetical protein
MRKLMRKRMPRITPARTALSLAGAALTMAVIAAVTNTQAVESKATEPAPASAVQSGAARRGAAMSQASTSRYLLTASIKELMDSTVDPAADGLWEAVSVISTSKGVEHHEPRTDEEWKAVRRHAITLIESMNLVVMPGRPAAPAGTAPGLGELPPAEIEQRIGQTPDAFIGFANNLRSTALKALTAIDHKDTHALLTLGGDIDAACEACHVTYWYPNQGSLK